MAGEDPAYTAWVRRLTCAAAGDDCAGAVQAHHAGERAGGDGARRAHDHTCVPLCVQHHTEWHACSGVFRLPREERKAWAVTAIADTRSAYGRPKASAVDWW